MPETVDELEVKKHVRMRSAAGTINVHCSDKIVGAWIGTGKRQIGVVAEKGQVFVCFNNNMARNAVPVALTTEGLQIPSQHGGVEVFPWSRLAEVLRK